MDRRTPRVRAAIPLLSICLALICGASVGDTQVGGTIYGNTTWGPDSPNMPDTVYVVVSDVFIQCGAVLTVEPGVTVRFNEGLSLACTNGWLVAEGTDAQGGQITFTSNQPEPLPGDWADLAGNTRGHMRLKHCVVEYGGASTWGGCVTGHNSDIYIADSLVRLSSTHGLRWEYYGAVAKDVRIDNCDAEDNGGSGINLYISSASECSPVISGCRVCASGYVGILCQYSGGASGSPTITGCEVVQSGPQAATGFGGEGIYCGYSAGTSGSPCILDCVCMYNANEGIECHFDGGSGDSTIARCTLLDNREDAVQCFYHGSTTHGNVHIADCVMERSEESGIEINHLCGSTGDCEIADCTFLGNRCGEANGQIYVEYIDGSSGNAGISRCSLRQSGCYGLLVYYTKGSSGDTLIRDCDVFDSAADGIHFWCYELGGSIVRASIDSCTISGSGQDGINAEACVGLSLSDVVSANGRNGVSLTGLAAAVSCCTCADNTYSGLVVKSAQCQVKSSIFAYNGAYGITSADTSLPEVSYCDFWLNTLGAMSGNFPGSENLSEDPEFADPEAGDYHLTCGSPCVDQGDPQTPPVDGTRIDMGALQFGGVTSAPDPQPYGSSALFGDTPGCFPGWIWFSIPLYPCGSTQPSDVLGFPCSGKLFRWDVYGKSIQAYRPPFTSWSLVPGEGYVLYHTPPVPNPSYAGESPQRPFEFKLGKLGWTWLGMPANAVLSGDDFMANVRVKYPSDAGGQVRTAQEDYDSTPGNWVSWGWAFFDTGTQSPRAFTPYSPFGNRDCHPWVGYRAWVRVGSASSTSDSDQVTLIWP
jgi:hypothetical protein